MSYQLLEQELRVLGDTLERFDNISLYVQLRFLSHYQLALECLDQDSCTLLRKLLAVTPTDVNAVLPVPMTVSCTTILQSIRSHMRSFTILPTSTHVWTITYLNQCSEWSAAPVPLMIPSMPHPVASDCHTTLTTADFLLYIQHLTLCEQYVRLTSSGEGDWTFQASGEFAAMTIRSPSVSSVTPRPTYTVSCTFKYLRALVTALQSQPRVILCLKERQYVYIELQTLSIWLFHRASGHGSGCG